MGNTVKKASLCEAIAGSINREDFERFEAEFADDVMAELLPKTAAVTDALGRLLSKPPVSGEEMLKQATALPERFDVLQVVPDGYGYILKWAAAPDGTEKKEKKVSKPEAEQAVPQEMLDTADQQGAATVTGVEAEPDPLQEQPDQISGFGLYKVYEAGTGQEIIGFVIPGLLDPRTGQQTPDMLFTNGSAFAVQPSMVGVLATVTFNLPQDQNDPRGLGIFYKSDGRSIVATIPVNILTRATIEGQVAYSAQTLDGMELQITPSEGIKKPFAVSPQEVVIPQDYSWMPLNNEIQVQGAETAAGEATDVMAQAKQAALPTMLEIRAWRNEQGPGGGCDLRGPVFEKNGSGTYDWVDGVFWLAAAGVPQNLSVACLEKAASSGEAIRLYGCRPLEPHRHELKEATAAAVADLVGLKLPERPNLLKEAVAIALVKEARALVGVDSVDNLLALNFLNPQNVETFVDYLPELEETSSKLASLVLATQMGLQAIPKTAAVSAMNSLETVIQGLKSLKTPRL
jgi:hypothetical protein